MSRTIRLGLFAVLALIQLAVPGLMIHQWEATLREGREYRFRTAPVDPYDAFRGRYVALRMESNSVAWAGLPIPRGQRVFVQLEEGADGFARLASLSLERPGDEGYVEVVVRRCYDKEVLLNLPFDRYYMKESLAPEAEKAYFRAAAHSNRTAHVQVRVRKGKAVIEELYIEGVPVGDYVRNKQVTQ